MGEIPRYLGAWGTQLRQREPLVLRLDLSELKLRCDQRARLRDHGRVLGLERPDAPIQGDDVPDSGSAHNQLHHDGGTERKAFSLFRHRPLDKKMVLPLRY
jgi:hypothetical protein